MISIKTGARKMILLHIEHRVENFEQWKASFDTYAELRQRTGVRRYQISRAVDDPNFVMVDLEFDELSGAESLLVAVQQIWQHVNGTLIHDPQWRFSEIVELKEVAV
jgi:hypothetical protein